MAIQALARFGYEQLKQNLIWGEIISLGKQHYAFFSHSIYIFLPYSCLSVGN